MFRHIRTLAEADIKSRQADKKTYTAPLSLIGCNTKEVSDFLFDHKRNFKESDATTILGENIVVKELHSYLVPDYVAEDDFWQRYCFRCNKVRIMKQLEMEDPTVIRERARCLDMKKSGHHKIRPSSAVTFNKVELKTIEKVVLTPKLVEIAKEPSYRNVKLKSTSDHNDPSIRRTLQTKDPTFKNFKLKATSDHTSTSKPMKQSKDPTFRNFKLKKATGLRSDPEMVAEAQQPSYDIYSLEKVASKSEQSTTETESDQPIITPLTASASHTGKSNVCITQQQPIMEKIHTLPCLDVFADSSEKVEASTLSPETTSNLSLNEKVKSCRAMKTQIEKGLDGFPILIATSTKMAESNPIQKKEENDGEERCEAVKECVATATCIQALQERVEALHLEQSNQADGMPGSVLKAIEDDANQGIEAGEESNETWHQLDVVGTNLTSVAQSHGEIISSIENLSDAATAPLIQEEPCFEQSGQTDGMPVSVSKANEEDTKQGIETDLESNETGNQQDVDGMNLTPVAESRGEIISNIENESDVATAQGIQEERRLEQSSQPDGIPESVSKANEDAANQEIKTDLESNEIGNQQNVDGMNLSSVAESRGGSISCTENSSREGVSHAPEERSQLRTEANAFADDILVDGTTVTANTLKDLDNASDEKLNKLGGQENPDDDTVHSEKQKLALDEDNEVFEKQRRLLDERWCDLEAEKQKLAEEERLMQKRRQELEVEMQKLDEDKRLADELRLAVDAKNQEMAEKKQKLEEEEARTFFQGLVLSRDVKTMSGTSRLEIELANAERGFMLPTKEHPENPLYKEVLSHPEDLQIERHIAVVEEVGMEGCDLRSQCLGVVPQEEKVTNTTEAKELQQTSGGYQNNIGRGEQKVIEEVADVKDETEENIWSEVEENLLTTKKKGFVDETEELRIFSARPTPKDAQDVEASKTSQAEFPSFADVKDTAVVEEKLKVQTNGAKDCPRRPSFPSIDNVSGAAMAKHFTPRAHDDEEQLNCGTDTFVEDSQDIESGESELVSEEQPKENAAALVSSNIDMEVPSGKKENDQQSLCIGIKKKKKKAVNKGSPPEAPKKKKRNKSAKFTASSIISNSMESSPDECLPPKQAVTSESGVDDNVSHEVGAKESGKADRVEPSVAENSTSVRSCQESESHEEANIILDKAADNALEIDIDTSTQDHCISYSTSEKPSRQNLEHGKAIQEVPSSEHRARRSFTNMGIDATNYVHELSGMDKNDGVASAADESSNHETESGKSTCRDEGGDELGASLTQDNSADNSLRAQQDHGQYKHTSFEAASNGTREVFCGNEPLLLPSADLPINVNGDEKGLSSLGRSLANFLGGTIRKALEPSSSSSLPAAERKDQWEKKLRDIEMNGQDNSCHSLDASVMSQDSFIIQAMAESSSNKDDPPPIKNTNLKSEESVPETTTYAYTEQSESSERLEDSLAVSAAADVQLEEKQNIEAFSTAKDLMQDEAPDNEPTSQPSDLKSDRTSNTSPRDVQSKETHDTTTTSKPAEGETKTTPSSNHDVEEFSLNRANPPRRTLSKIDRDAKRAFGMVIE